MSKGTECFLRSVDGRHPDLVLEDGVEVAVGRGPNTKIKEPRCSRQQLVLTANLAEHTVTCLQKGGNPSEVAGHLLKLGDSALVRHKQTLDLLPGEYKYMIVFNPPPQSLNLPSEHTSTKEEEKTSKRKLSDSLSQRSDAPPEKRTCNGPSSRLPWFKPEPGLITSTKGGFEWRRVYDGKVLVMRTENSRDSCKVAAFDLDGTIITTNSGKVFAVDKNDWKILYPEVPGKLKSLHRDGFKIVIISNQSGISKGKVREEDFQEKVERISTKLGVPLQLICSTSDGFFRKPRPGVWFWLRETGNAGLQIDMDQSFYCGDAAGREPNWMDKKKKDFSCSDRLFAINLGLKFFTPEEYFQGQKPTKKFCLPKFDPREKISKPLLEPETEPLNSKQQEMVLLAGIQGSGKSHVAERLEKIGYVVASNDRSGGKDKSLRISRDALKEGKSVVVDNTHRDKESRREYVEQARQFKVPARCFLMNTSHDHARHNNLYREIIDAQHTRIKEALFNNYRSKFEEPTVSEGFSSVIRVNFVPSFKDEAHQQLYSMHLLEK